MNASSVFTITLCLIVVLTLSCTFTRRLVSFPNLNKVKHFWREGSPIILHGVNFANSSKEAGPIDSATGRPTAGHPWHGEKEFALLERCGLNFSRYLVFWEAMEPTRGTYDEEYFDTVEQKIRALGDHGVYVVVDIHQDLFARRYGGNGFPDWAVRDDGKSFKRQEPWAKNYFQPAVQACFDNLWSNKDGILDAYIELVRKVYRRLGRLPNVIGIDIMNEPWPKGWPMTFERKRLSSFYETVRQRVWAEEAHDDDGVLAMIEPWMSTSAGYPTNMRKPIWYGDPRMTIGYMPHYYDFFCEQGKKYTWFNKLCMKRGMNIRSAEAQEFSTPMIIGEFGFPGSSKGHIEALDDFLALADRHSASWAYYSFDQPFCSDRPLLDENGNPTVFLAHLVRIYPMRINGLDVRYCFNDDVFTMTWKNAIGPNFTESEIFVPEEWEVEITADGGYRREGRRVFVDCAGPGNPHKVTIRVLNRNGFPL